MSIFTLIQNQNVTWHQKHDPQERKLVNWIALKFKNSLCESL
jgi:hypothetical protein